MSLARLLVLSMALIVAAGLPEASQGASFDCDKATTPREKLICSDPALSELDAQLGQKYQERRALLSAQGAELLHRSEQSWLRFVDTVCPQRKDEKLESWQRPEFCLKREYDERLNQLSEVGKKLGPYVFNRIDLFSASASTAKDKDGHRSGFSYQHIGYPQIDNVKNQMVEAWNKAALKKLPIRGDCGGGADYDIEYSVAFANDHVISSILSDYTYCHGTAHGFGSSITYNLVLSPHPHELVPSELFAPDSNWQNKLALLFWEALQDQGWEPVNEGAKNGILSEATSPKNWLFTAEGLRVEFSSYAGGCYTCTPRPVTLPWADLKPLLGPHAIVP